MPGAALRPLLPSYAVPDADPAIWTGPDDWLLPGWTQLWILLTKGPVAVSMRRVPALLARLNGTKHLVRGNNDDPETGDAGGWSSVQDCAELRTMASR